MSARGPEEIYHAMKFEIKFRVSTVFVWLSFYLITLITLITLISLITLMTLITLIASTIETVHKQTDLYVVRYSMMNFENLGNGFSLNNAEICFHVINT